ncbi:MAG: preprotein translocase subunit SecE [Minisyncoccia bacterium]
MSRLTDYLKETREELRHVSWPTRRQSIAFTVGVIAISLLAAAYLGFFDFLFSQILKKFIL